MPGKAGSLEKSVRPFEHFPPSLDVIAGKRLGHPADFAAWRGSGDVVAEFEVPASIGISPTVKNHTGPATL